MRAIPFHLNPSVLDTFTTLEFKLVDGPVEVLEFDLQSTSTSKTVLKR